MDRSVRFKSLVWFFTGAAVTLVATVVVLQAWRVDAAPGDSDTTFVPITPCRLVDTRQPGEDPLGPGAVRTFAAHGTNGPIVGSQCTIPTDAVGLSMNVTALGATALTFWTIWPEGEPRPDASSLNPSPAQPPTPNAVTTPISATGRFSVFNEMGTVGMLIDVNGYYTKASLQELASRLAAVEAAQATNSSNIAAIDAREPFAVTARNDTTPLLIGTDAMDIVEVSVTAPTGGQVTVGSTMTAGLSTAGDDMFCSIREKVTPAAVDDDYVQWFEGSGLGAGGFTQLAGTRVFDIAADATTTYSLVCRYQGAAVFGAASDPVITAVFTPAP